MRNFILGTDWWDDCDDAVAIRLLVNAHKNKEISLKGIIINACMECSAVALDGFLSAEGINDIPIGIDLDATDHFYGGRAPYQFTLTQYAEKYKSNRDAENAVRLYRKILAEATEPVDIVEIGFLQAIAGAIESEPDDISPLSGIELFKEKVSKIWVMAGKWNENPGKENNFARNARTCKASHIFCRKCPVPVTFLGFEVGVDVITGDELSSDDVLHTVLCAHGSQNGRCSWDPMLALLALIGDEAKAGYDVAQGTATVDPETGENRFTEDANGLHRYVIKNKPNEFYKDQVNSLIRK